MRALAAQAGVSYMTSVDPARVRRAPGGLSADMVRALGLLPFEAETQERRLHVICTAPLPRPALRAMARLTGWTAEPYLVDDAVWERALEDYAPDAASSTSRRSCTTSDAASAQVVVAAAVGRDAVVRYAGCGDFVWVRVEGGARTQLDLDHPGGTAMPGGAYSALSGMQARLADLDRLASDIANVGTSGYKTERAATVAAERPSFRAALDSAVDVTTGGTRLDFRPGTIGTTGRDLDAAIEGAGFFVVNTPNGERYTRNGSFVRRGDGVLTAADGLPIVPEHRAAGQNQVGTGTISHRRGRHGEGGRRGGRQAEARGVRVGDRHRARVGHALPRQAGRDARGGDAAHRRRLARTVERDDGGPDGDAHRGAAHLRGAPARVSMLMNDIDARAISELGRR